MPRSKPKHILLIRASAMGDVAMCVPVVKALRRDRPELRITVLTRAAFRPFFRDVPGLEFLEVDFGGADKGLKGVWRVARRAQKCGADAVADLHDVLRSKLIRGWLRLCGRRVAVIDKGRAEKRALTRKHRKFRLQLTPTVMRYYDTIRAAGVEFAPPTPESRHSCPIPGKIAEIAGERTSTWIGIAPFARHEGKIYPIAQTDRLIELLSERYQRVFIFGGGKHERDFAEHMQERYRNITSVVGLLSLSEEMDLMANLGTIITMDSATMHIASLVGTPVVSVWGATHPFAGFYGFGQDMRNAIQVDIPCRPCSVYGNKPCFMGDLRCMARIEPEVIVRAVERI